MRIAAIQMQSTPDAARNRRTADRLVRAAAGAGAGLVVLPEKWSCLGTPDDQDAGAEPLDGPAIAWARAIAAELGLDLVAGSIAERRPDRPLRSNTSVHVAPDGSIAAVYRKRHLFDADVDGVTYRESDREEAGDEVILSRLADGTGLGLSVCYDLRFPEHFRELAIRGARILVVPAAFTPRTTLEHWEVLLRARAIEDQCVVVAANQCGEHVRGFRSGGHSMIVDPWGVVLSRAAEAEQVVLSDVPLERIDEVRAEVPSLANRRPGAGKEV